jgi:hypothetical protein
MLSLYSEAASRPSMTSRTYLSPEDRRRLGATDRLVHMSIGIAAIEDLLEGFDQASTAERGEQRTARNCKKRPRSKSPRRVMLY